MFQCHPPSPRSPVYTGIAELFWFNLDTLTDEHFEPHKCVATFQVVVFVACVCMCVCLYRGIGEVELFYCILNI